MGFFCSYPTGICGFDAGYGYCKQIEAVCPHIVQPVCGCDGRTYENYCYADKANVSINYEGKCNGTPPSFSCSFLAWTYMLTFIFLFYFF